LMFSNSQPLKTWKCALWFNNGTSFFFLYTFQKSKECTMFGNVYIACLSSVTIEQMGI
jgi:hypothetical protein